MSLREETRSYETQQGRKQRGSCSQNERSQAAGSGAAELKVAPLSSPTHIKKIKSRTQDRTCNSE